MFEDSRTFSFRKRILADIVLLCAVFLLPWWMSVAIGIIFACYIENYYELLVTGLVIDSMYHVPIAHYLHFQFVVSLVCAISFLIILPLRRRLRFS